MNIKTFPVSFALLLTVWSQMKGAEEMIFPPGASDLVPVFRYDPFQGSSVEPIHVEVKMLWVGDITWSSYRDFESDLGYQKILTDIHEENQRLREEIEYLKRRLTALTEAVAKKSELDDADNRGNAPENPENQPD